MTIPLQVVFKNIKEVKSPPSIINIFNEIRLRQNLCIDHSFFFVYSDRIDLHFCDDPGGGRSSHPDLAQGGAFQVSLKTRII